MFRIFTIIVCYLILTGSKNLYANTQIVHIQSTYSGVLIFGIIMKVAPKHEFADGKSVSIRLNVKAENKDKISKLDYKECFVSVKVWTDYSMTLKRIFGDLEAIVCSINDSGGGFVEQKIKGNIVDPIDNIAGIKAELIADPKDKNQYFLAVGPGTPLILCIYDYE